MPQNECINVIVKRYFEANNNISKAATSDKNFHTKKKLENSNISLHEEINCYELSIYKIQEEQKPDQEDK